MKNIKFHALIFCLLYWGTTFGQDSSGYYFRASLGGVLESEESSLKINDLYYGLTFRSLGYGGTSLSSRFGIDASLHRFSQDYLKTNNPRPNFISQVLVLEPTLPAINNSVTVISALKSTQVESVLSNSTAANLIFTFRTTEVENAKLKFNLGIGADVVLQKFKETSKSSYLNADTLSITVDSASRSRALESSFSTQTTRFLTNASGNFYVCMPITYTSNSIYFYVRPSIGFTRFAGRNENALNNFYYGVNAMVLDKKTGIEIGFDLKGIVSEKYNPVPGLTVYVSKSFSFQQISDLFTSDSKEGSNEKSD